MPAFRNTIPSIYSGRGATFLQLMLCRVLNLPFLSFDSIVRAVPGRVAGAGPLSAMDGAIEPYMDVFTGVSSPSHSARHSSAYEARNSPLQPTT